ncbi:hypothetical protein [Sphingopyxis sp.]|jgi:hypothetical protein|uniref:hypothetical protein n=1 Tax=Sphingopyxis sp. TaxID=1908224 RepID=UPI002DF1E8E1|nr:hypothetical protein [Sphingopyxis sp.]
MAKLAPKLTLNPSRDIQLDRLELSQSNVRRVKAGVSIDTRRAASVSSADRACCGHLSAAWWASPDKLEDRKRWSFALSAPSSARARLPDLSSRMDRRQQV